MAIYVYIHASYKVLASNVQAMDFIADEAMKAIDAKHVERGTDFTTMERDIEYAVDPNQVDLAVSALEKLGFRVEKR